MRRAVADTLRKRVATALVALLLTGALVTPARAVRVVGPTGRRHVGGQRTRSAADYRVGEQALDTAAQGAPSEKTTRKKNEVKTLIVEPLSDAIEGDISSQPGGATFDDPLPISVTAPTSGWNLKIRAEPLKWQGDRPVGPGGRPIIRAQELALVTEDEPLSLGGYQDVVSNGDSGSVTLQIRLMLLGETAYRAGDYAGYLHVVTQYHGPVGGAGPSFKVPIRLTLLPWARHTYDGTRMYFHFGRPNEPLSEYVTGRVSATAPMSLVLTVDYGDRLDRMPLLRRAFTDNQQGIEACYIPVAWRLRDTCSPVLREPDHAAQDARSLYWNLGGTPGTTDYDLELMVEPQGYQAPGDYGMSVEMRLTPRL